MKKLINHIREPFCSFEVSKLLKKKGFDTYTRLGMITSLYDMKGNSSEYANYGVMYSGLSDGYISRPTHMLAIEWLRLNFGIWLQVTFNTKMEWYEAEVLVFIDGEYKYTIELRDKSELDYGWDSPAEAAEEGLKLVVNNLIN